jgi:hypothetical protein
MKSYPYKNTVPEKTGTARAFSKIGACARMAFHPGTSGDPRGRLPSAQNRTLQFNRTQWEKTRRVALVALLQPVMPFFHRPHLRLYFAATTAN